MDDLLKEDLQLILKHTRKLWKELRGEKVFITGGTGFFGCWLLESFILANLELELGASALVLTRDYKTFNKKAPHLCKYPFVQFHIGDIKNFVFPKNKFRYIIHMAATSASESWAGVDPLEKFETVVAGTRHLLDFAVFSKAKKVLFTSSGAVYGKQPWNIRKLSEDFIGAPSPLQSTSVWGIAKRCAEYLCYYYANKYNMEVKVARCFSFVGPYLPLNVQYAIGNFINDVLCNKSIYIKGNPSTKRSYLYASDLAVWLWTILFKGKSCRPYNVGSEKEVSIMELAHKVVECSGKSCKIKIDKSAYLKRKERYIPDTKRARTELGLTEIIGLEEAIKRTFAFYSAIGRNDFKIFKKK